MTDTLPLPDWPHLLTLEQACAYLGLGAGTFRTICPVRPVDLGVNLTRWRRTEIDAWVAGLPARLPDARARAQDAASAAPAPPPVTPATERREGALQRVRRRSQTCQTTKARGALASQA